MCCELLCSCIKQKTVVRKFSHFVENYTSYRESVELHRERTPETCKEFLLNCQLNTGQHIHVKKLSEAQKRIT